MAYVTLDEIKEYVGSEEFDHDELLLSCAEDATTLIDKYVGEATVPADMLARCTLIVAADLFERRNAPNGIANQQYASVDGIGQAPMRVARDPMAGVYHILRRWVLPF